MTDRADVLAIAEQQIKFFETGGPFIAHAIPDPLSHADPWTIGWGQTGPDIGPDTIWTQAFGQADFDKRLNANCDYYDRMVPWWQGMDAVRAAVIPNMGWNLGPGFIHTWPHFMAACQSQDWPAAKYAMLNPPTWLNQVHGRATTLAEQILTGIVAT